MEQVQCRDIRHSYDGVRDAVSALSLAVRRNEVLALIGPNGAGKSTTLRVLATLQRPDHGSVLWDGVDAWEDRFSIRRRIGFLGDGTALYPSMTAAGYLRFFAECYGQDDATARRRVGEVLTMFDLSSKADAAISELSKGMRQRLAIARTLVHEPELLLLDEPADGLDPLARRQLRDILRELDGFCDTVALIQKGKLEVHGSVEEVIDDYEVGRRLHEVHVTRGLQTALEVLRKHEGLVEGVRPLHKGEPQPDLTRDDRGLLTVRIHGTEERAAHLLRELVLADVEVIALAKVRSDLEDVYQSMGRDEVS